MIKTPTLTKNKKKLKSKMTTHKHNQTVRLDIDFGPTVSLSNNDLLTGMVKRFSGPPFEPLQ